jgi:hypothetical protein
MLLVKVDGSQGRDQALKIPQSARLARLAVAAYGMDELFTLLDQVFGTARGL